MKLIITLLFAMILFIVGFILAAQCVADLGTVKPVLTAMFCLFAGVLFREVHYTQD